MEPTNLETKKKTKMKNGQELDSSSNDDSNLIPLKKIYFRDSFVFSNITSRLVICDENFQAIYDKNRQTILISYKDQNLYIPFSNVVWVMY